MLAYKNKSKTSKNKVAKAEGKSIKENKWCVEFCVNTSVVWIMHNNTSTVCITSIRIEEFQWV